MDRTILLIGGAGFIGSAIVRRLLQDKRWRVVVLEPERASKQRLEPYRGQIEIVECDIRNSALILKVLEEYNINIVVHLVSTMIPGSTISHFQNETADILMPTMNIIELCAERHIRFIYFSSGGTVYGNSKTIHHEADPCEPISYYGLSKLMTEEMIKFEHRRTGLEYLILRPSNPYGPGQNIYGKQGLIAVALGKIINKQELTIWGNGEAIRDYIYIDNLADAVYQLIDREVINDTFNIGSGVGYSVNDILKIINTVTDNKLRVNFVQSRTVDVDKMVLDIQKLKNTIDISFVDITEGINRFIQYLKQK